jgi:uncharacterized FlaG/YvyC family protein
MSDIGPISSVGSTPEVNSHAAETAVRKKHGDVAQLTKPVIDLKTDEKAVVKAVVEVETLVNAVSETSLSFSVDKELSRMVVAVRAVGSDEIIRQFPPEEFMTVAKFIAAQNPDSLDEDFLKGILYDQFT